MFLKLKVEELNTFATTSKLEKELKIKKRTSWLHEIINDYKICNEARYDGINKFIRTAQGKTFFNKIVDPIKKRNFRVTDNDITGCRGIVKIGNKVFIKGLKLFYGKGYAYEKGQYKLNDLKSYITYDKFLKTNFYKDYNINTNKVITEKEFNKIIVVEYTQVA